MVSFKVYGLLCLISVVYALPSQEKVRDSRNVLQSEDDLLNSVYEDCLHKDSLSCVKYKLFNLVDKIGQKDTITLTDGVELKKTENKPKEDERSLDGDETIESLFLNRVKRFLETHTLSMDLKGSELIDAAQSSARSFTEAFADDSEDDGTEEGRGKKKKVKKILGPLMAIAGLKMAILGKLALAVIAFIATKALIIGKLALVLTAIIGFKKLFGGEKHVTHEVVAHPHHSSSHEAVYGGSGTGYSNVDIGGISSSSSSHGGWQRSLDAQQLAYRGQLSDKKQ